VFGVLFGDLGAVTQGFGDNGWGHGQDECAAVVEARVLGTFYEVA
jgi:hypothetical protein